MSTGYIGLSNVAKQVSNIYIGVGGVAKEVTAAYIGVNGVAQLAYSKGNSKPWLCFKTAEANCAILLNDSGAGTVTRTDSFEYSYDGKLWYNLTLGISTMSLVNIGDKVYIRAKTTNAFAEQSDSSYYYFTASKKVYASGNIMSLLDKDCLTTEVPNYGFYRLFAGSVGIEVDLLSAPELPALSLGDYCYAYLFYYTNLPTAPVLPALRVPDYGYYCMFFGCKFTTPPTLSATVLGKYCYAYMFRSADITSAPVLPATDLAEGCYQAMFEYSEITVAPTLPSQVAKPYCYNEMFAHCYHITTAPLCKTHNLANHCFDAMFKYCTGLTTVLNFYTKPQGSISDATYCFYEMYYGCTSLTQLHSLRITTITTKLFAKMYFGCSSAIKLSETQTGEYTTAFRIPSSGTGTAVSGSMDDMFFGTAGTFTGTPTVNTTYYTSNTVV